MIARDLEVIISEAIEQLLKETGVSAPSASRPIAPLSDLVSALNVTCTELESLTDGAAVDFLLRRGAVVEPPSNLSREPLAGFLYAGASFGSIFVERNDLVVRRRFSAAHELGHYMCHFRPFLSAIENDGEPMLDSFPIADPEAEPGDLPVGEISAPGVMEFFGLTFEQMEREANQRTLR